MDHQAKQDIQADASGKWGSDIVADAIRALGYPYAVLVPGASFRGLHDSIVNYLENRDPRMVVCLHENHAVSIADGYSRVTETPLLVILHSNVGLMNGLMGIYNAWCDRRPMLILGGTGPVDAFRRRPWIDWVHTSKDQGALLRSFVKWDDQPASPEAMVESIFRAHQITQAEPRGPVYVCLDAEIQEKALDRQVFVPPADRFKPPQRPAVPSSAVAAVDAALRAARHPLVLFGRVSRSRADWDKRIDFAERYGASILSSMHNAPAFPVDHPLHVLPVVGDKPTEDEMKLIAESDVILSLDWVDLAGFLRARTGHAQTQIPVSAKIIECSLDSSLTNGWSMDHQALAAIDIPVFAHPDTLIAQLLEVDAEPARRTHDRSSPPTHWMSRQDWKIPREVFDLTALAFTVLEWSRNLETTLARVPIGWPQRACVFRDPLDFLGKDGGGAVGTGPGHIVGAALALKDSDRIVVGVIGDGDFSMGMNALWTAANQNLALLIVVANNRSYFNDEVHQERIAIQRSRPVENKGVGQKLECPFIDLGAIAAAQGFEANAPVTNVDELAAALARGANVVRAGGRYFIDAQIHAGYSKI